MKGQKNGTRRIHHGNGGLRFWGLWIGLGIGCIALLAAPHSIAIAATLIRANQINLADSFNFTNTFTTATITTIDGVSPNMVTLDFRGTTVPSNTALNKTIAYNINTVGNTNSMVREQMTVNAIGASGSVLSHYFVTSYANGTNGNVLDGVSTEAQTTGTLTGTLASITGNESVASILSTGGTVTLASGLQGYCFNQPSNTTLVTECRGLDGIGARMTGTAPTNAYGLYGRFQSAGTSRNYSIGLESIGLLKYSNGIAGLDAEDPALATHRFLFIASDNSANIQAVNAVGLNFASSDGITRGRVTSSGLATITALFPSVAGNHPVGSNAFPYSGFFIGTAATNNFNFLPAATSAGVTVNIADPGKSSVGLPLTIANGTAAMTTAGILTGACGATVTVAATGALTTDVINLAHNAAATIGNGGGLTLNAWPTSGNVNFNYCNSAAGTITPTAMTVNWSVVR